MKNPISQKWRHISAAINEIVALKTKYPEITKRIAGIASVTECRSLDRSYAKAKEMEEKMLEKIDKNWVRFAQKNEDKAEKVLRSVRILKTRVREENPNVYRDVFGN